MLLRQCDIRQDHFPNRVFDAVVHLAALAGVRPSMTHPLGYHQTNVTGTLRLLEFYAWLLGPRFVTMRFFSNNRNQSRPDPKPGEVDLGDVRILVLCFD